MNLDLKDYAEYQANVEVFAALEKAGVYYDSNISEILYEHIYDELVDIIKNATENDFSFVCLYDCGNKWHSSFVPVYRCGAMEYYVTAGKINVVG